MNFHKILGDQIQTPIEQWASKTIGNILLASMLVNVVTVTVLLNKWEKKTKK